MSLTAAHAVLADSLVADSAPKFGVMLAALGGFFGILLVIFFAAGRAAGHFQRSLTITLMLGPAGLLIMTGLVIPAIRTVVLSFQNSSVKNPEFIGLDNYMWAFTSPDQQKVLINTVVWIVLAPLLATGFGLVLALLADRMPRRSEAVTKSLIFLPMGISFVGASIIWKFVYEARSPGQPQVGLLSQVVIGLGWSEPPNWLLWQPWNTLLLIVIMVWVETGFAMVLLSAAIKAIPAEVIEATEIDGASGWRSHAGAPTGSSAAWRRPRASPCRRGGARSGRSSRSSKMPAMASACRARRRPPRWRRGCVTHCRPGPHRWMC